MKNIRLYAFPLLLFLIVCCGIYIYQQTLTLSKTNLHTFEGVYQKMDLKKDRTYPLKIYLEKYNNVYVLNKNTYKAWKKHRFKSDIKAGALLQISIKKENRPLQTNNNQANLIEVITLKNNDTYYLSLANYNTFQKGGLFKFYLIAALVLAVYFVAKKLQAKVIKLELE